jgi:hypothetical protein
MDSAADIAFWNTQMHLILEKVEGKTADTATSHQAAPAGQKACRYQLIAFISFRSKHDTGYRTYCLCFNIRKFIWVSGWSANIFLSLE